MHNLNGLWVFYAVALEKSLTLGAKRLHLSQSAVSQSLKQLEESYDLRFAERSRRGFSLTEAGEQLFQTLNNIFSELERTEESLKGLRQQPRGQVTLGADITLGMSYFMKHVGRLKELYPELAVHLRLKSNTRDVLEALMDEEIDIGSINEDFLPSHDKISASSFVLESRVILYASPKLLQQHRPLKSVEDLFMLPFIEPSPTVSAAQWFFGKLAINLKFQKVLWMDAGAKEAVLEGLGISIAPHFYIEKELKEKKLVQLFPRRCVVKRRDRICCLARRKEIANIALLCGYFHSLYEGESSFPLTTLG